MAEEKFQIRILDGSLSSMREEPTPLEDALVYFATRYPGQHLSVDQLIPHACSKNANDQLKLSLHGAFNYWDHASGLAWTNGTTPNTKERRRRVYDCLKLSPKQAHDLDSAIPLYVAEHPTVIAGCTNFGTITNVLSAASIGPRTGSILPRSPNGTKTPSCHWMKARGL